MPNSNFFSTQLLFPGTLPNFSSQKCPGRTCLSSCGDQSSRVCTHPHLSGLAFSNSLTTIAATLTSRFRIPDDAVTVNSSSVQKVYLVRVQPSTMRPPAPPIVSPCKGIMSCFSFMFLGVPRHYVRRSYSCW